MEQVDSYLKSRRSLFLAIGAYLSLVLGWVEVKEGISLFHQNLVLKPEAFHSFFWAYIMYKLYDLVVNWILLKGGNKDLSNQGFLSTELGILIKATGGLVILMVSAEVISTEYGLDWWRAVLWSVVISFMATVFIGAGLKIGKYMMKCVQNYRDVEVRQREESEALHHP